MIRQVCLFIDEEIPQAVMLSLIVCVGFLGHYHPSRAPVRSKPKS